MKCFINLDVIIASIMLVALIFLTFLGVITRYVMSQPLTWMEEVQMFCLIWIVFGAGGAAFRYGNHVAIEMVVELFPKKVQRYIEVLVSIIVILTLLYLLYQSFGFISIFVKSGRSTSMLEIPFSLIYSIAPISFVLMILNHIYVFKNNFFSKEGGDN
ncbi:C4-dicarboxylate ABC transporter permease [Candidatus Epulonipiscium fishelsonii]|uniref:C4-dicarboxylate ABC transporter permease n=1 Tax=Candidatus Epulonipiscium fishelsonii TaxID=77094 RepID=A0ACC8XD15_9FIRM|nr:C4-dicarboxylate ABC transporter permease [Epulopiscium sp. SCG-B11WGA-EpuloA1]ONI43219.1 C4-dicarboxylate ABC transporter permease [Epulopiscium sp. SCG-B05WGA-EpuloA1]ONI46790.1 C4-dicarboxylate ABC transporter permease [Epulopiscium sp. SCG-C06WGA-EpuloA1]